MAYTKKPRAPRRRVRKMRMPRKVASGNQPEWASMSETKEYLPGSGLTVNSIYNFSDLQLAQFPRASTVAEGYQQFRITRVKFQVTPLLDTFAAGGATQTPYLFWVINRTGQNYAGLNKAWFIANGAKPLRFDDKTITIQYAPAVVLDAVEAGTPGVGNQANVSKTKTWLSCNKEAFTGAPFAPSQTSHCGHFMTVQSENSTQEMSYKVLVTVEFQFKKPSAPNLGSDTQPLIRL